MGDHNREDGVVQGLALALAELNRMHDQPTMVVDVARSTGVTIERAIRAGVDEFDIAELQRAGVP